MDDHLKILDSLCRICGQRLKSYNDYKRGNIPKRKEVTMHTDLIAQLGFDPNTDEAAVHPRYLCHLCYTALKSPRSNPNPVVWKPHTRLGPCTTCQRHTIQSKGGRPRKRKCGLGAETYNQNKITKNNIVDHFSSIMCQQLIKIPSSFSLVTIGSLDAFTCCFCQSVCISPVALPCNHVSCKACIQSCFVDVDKTVCPKCNFDVHFSSVTSVPALFIECYLSCKVVCKSCRCVIQCRECNVHVCVRDHDYYCASPNQMDPIAEMLTRPLDAPLTPNMEKIGRHIIKSKLNQSKDGTTTFYDNGKILKSVAIPVFRKPSSSVCHKTLQNRTKFLTKVRDLVSGGDGVVQQKNEVRSMPSELQTILAQPIKMPFGDLLSLKTNLGLTWKRNRELKQWLKKYGIAAECEGKMRIQVKEIVNDNFTSEYLPLLAADELTKDMVIQKVACVQVKNLIQKIHQNLSELESLNLLTWHGGLIPNDEIWLKIGGDKGGGNFKLMYQICNVAHPNSLNNTINLLVFEGTDNLFNLKTSMTNLIPQINELHKASWKGKKFRLFAFGDYEYLTRMYGITGANGRHYCLYCHHCKSSLGDPRSLETLRRDLERFQDDGNRLHRAKFFNNVVANIILNIPLNQVCPPGLHISLGLYLKHFKSFEDACQVLDNEMGFHLANYQMTEETNQHRQQFNFYVSQLQKARLHETEADAIQTAVASLEDYLSVFLILNEDINNLQEIIKEIEDKKGQQQYHTNEAMKFRNVKLDKGFGPICGKIDSTLKSFGVQRQAYHGQSFVGNHVHKCCKTENINKLTDMLLQETQLHCPALMPSANIVAKKYNLLFKKFAECHNMYNIAAPFDKEMLKKLEMNISSYLSFFRENFEETEPPKMHLLEHHVCSWIAEWGLGLGFHGEQGGESMHAQLNTIMRDIRGTTDRVQILQSAMKSHWVKTSPRMLAARPEKKK
ncbi:uncharacterized protein [Antedon mediterranea]|uniref:uncharacterized protein n=1 Tax=Antedon mediterranea TaxID=105859 RepID=UPI003AF73B37